MDIDQIRQDNARLQAEILNAKLKRRRDRAILESSASFDWVAPYTEYLDQIRGADP